MPFISKHISCAQDHWTFEHQRKHDGRPLYGCALARFLNISVICLCIYVLDMFFNALNYIFEPHSICDSFENSNSYLSMQDPETASYSHCYLSNPIVTLLIYDKSVTPYATSFRRRFLAYYTTRRHSHTNIILLSFGIPLVLKCAANILKIGSQIKL